MNLNYIISQAKKYISSVDLRFTPTGNISSTNVQDAVVESVDYSTGLQDLTSRIDPKPILDIYPYPDQVVVPSIISFSRGGGFQNGDATYVNNQGIITTAPTNVIRSQYDPETKKLLGWLTEGQRTNECLYSEDLTNAAWIKTGVGTTVTGDTYVSPDGNTTADRVTFTAGGGKSVSQDITTGLSPSDTVTFSLYMRKISGTPTSSDLRLEISGSVSSASVTNIGGTITDDFQRFVVTATLDGAPTSINVSINSDVAGVYAVWGAQLETGDYSTSYIPTEATTVTRYKDEMSVDLNSVNDMPSNGAPFSVFSEFILPSGENGTTAYVYTIYQSNDNIIYLSTLSDTITLYFSSTTSGSSTLTQTGIPFGSSCRVAVRCENDNYALCMAINDFDLGNGVGSSVQVGTEDTFETPSALADITFGADQNGDNHSNIIQSRGMIYASGLSDSELLSLCNYY